MMQVLTKTENLTFRAGAILMLVGALTYVFGGGVPNILYATGIVMFVAMQLRTVYDGPNFTLRRLRRQQLAGAVAFVLSAVLMTSQTLGHYWIRYNEWVVLMLIGAVLQFYTALRIPQELKKENKNHE